jgi:hypothetical protein
MRERVALAFGRVRNELVEALGGQRDQTSSVARLDATARKIRDDRTTEIDRAGCHEAGR